MNRFRLDAAATFLIAGLAFALSYSQLAELAARAGYGPVMAHVWPLVVDGLAVVATAAVMRLRASRLYAWSLLAAATVVSVVAGAAAHLLPAGPLPGWAGAAVAVVPPLCLLVAPHLAVQLRRDAADEERAETTDEAVHAIVDTDAPDDGPTREAEPEADAPAVTLTAVPDLSEHRDAPADQQRRTPAHAADTLFDIDAPAPESADAPPVPTVEAARESNDAKWPHALHLLTTTQMSQRAVAEEVGMSDAALRRRIGPNGRDALKAEWADATPALAAVGG